MMHSFYPYQLGVELGNLSLGLADQFNAMSNHKDFCCIWCWRRNEWNQVGHDDLVHFLVHASYMDFQYNAYCLSAAYANESCLLIND